MKIDKAYIPYYKDLRTCSRLNLVIERKSKSWEVWVVNGNEPTAKPIKVKAVATRTPDCKGIHFAVREEGGNFDFELDINNVRTNIKMHHADKFSWLER